MSGREASRQQLETEDVAVVANIKDTSHCEQSFKQMRCSFPVPDNDGGKKPELLAHAACSEADIAGGSDEGDVILPDDVREEHLCKAYRLMDVLIDVLDPIVESPQSEELCTAGVGGNDASIQQVDAEAKMNIHRPVPPPLDNACHRADCPPLSACFPSEIAVVQEQAPAPDGMPCEHVKRPTAGVAPQVGSSGTTGPCRAGGTPAAEKRRPRRPKESLLANSS